MKTFLIAAAAAAVFAAAPAAATVTVTFDSLVAPTYLGNGDSVTDSGFTFTSNSGAYNYLWDGSATNSNGTNNLVSSGFFGAGPGFTITKVGGGSFKLVSFDAAISFYSTQTTATLTAGSAVVNYTPTLTTYTVNQTGSSITISNGLTDGYWTIDNVVFGSAVPEPASWSMLITGFGLIGFAARRRAALAA